MLEQTKFFSWKPDLPDFFSGVATHTSLLIEEDLSLFGQEINAAAFLTKHGNLTSLSIHDEFISVGFQSGFVNIIDHYQRQFFSIPPARNLYQLVFCGHVLLSIRVLWRRDLYFSFN